MVMAMSGFCRKRLREAIENPKSPKKDAVYSTKRLHSGMLAPNNRKSAMSLCSTSAPAWNNISNLSANGLFIGM